MLGNAQAEHLTTLDGITPSPHGFHKVSYYHINSGPGPLTVDLLRATLGVHEYYGHGILGLDNSIKSHNKIRALVNEYLSDPNR